MSLEQYEELAADEQQLWVEKWREERGRCTQCGLPLEVCLDHERQLYPFRVVCYGAMEREAAQAAYEQLHKDAPYHDGTFKSWAAERSPSHPFRYSDGVTFGVAETDPAPHDTFTTHVDASPVPPDPNGGDPDGNEA